MLKLKKLCSEWLEFFRVTDAERSVPFGRVCRICKDQGNESLLFALAKEFHENGLELRPALYDVCISSAANAGEGSSFPSMLFNAEVKQVLLPFTSYLNLGKT